LLRRIVYDPLAPVSSEGSMTLGRRGTASLGSIVMAALAVASSAAFAQNGGPDHSLQQYFVQIIKTRVLQQQQDTLNGIYLGNGAALTAAHVVGRWQLLKELQVRIAGQVLPASVVKEGSLDTVDLTVLSVDDEQLPVSVRLRRNPVCQGPARIGQEVVVVTAGGVARSRVISPLLIPASARAKYGTVIGDVPGAISGTGVFDARRRCLLGIISRRVARLDAAKADAGAPGKLTRQAKYFVPAPVIAEFLPLEFRF
jgi:hypothetical protein